MRIGVLQIVHSYFCFRKLNFVKNLLLLVKAVFAESVSTIGGHRLIEYFEAYNANEFLINFLII